MAATDRPIVICQIAFASDPLAASPTWTDVSAYFLSLDSKYGRQYDLGRFEAGQATIVLDNTDRRFDPTNASSPYVPNIVPAKKIRVSAVWSATTYYVFTGYIEAWPPGWDAPLSDEMALPCSDGFLYFNGVKYSGTLPNEYSNSAVETFLDVIGWPSGIGNRLNTGHGQTFIQGDAYTNLNALQYLQNITDAENGAIFIDGQGRVNFQGRHYRILNSGTSDGVFGYDLAGGQIPYAAIEPVYDDTQIYNDVHVSAVGGTEQIATDSASQQAYFTRSLPKLELIIGDGSAFGSALPDAEAAGMAQWLLYNHKDAALRFRSLTVSGHADDSVWPHALGRVISDRVTAVWVPPSGATITRDCYIESIAQHITQDEWTTTWELSAADAAGGATSWWIWDDPVHGVWTTDDRWAY